LLKTMPFGASRPVRTVSLRLPPLLTTQRRSFRVAVADEQRALSPIAIERASGCRRQTSI